MYTVPYGKGTIQFSLPPGMRVTQAVSKPVRPVENEKAAVAAALAHPIGTPPLREMARPGNARLYRFYRHHALLPGPFARAAPSVGAEGRPACGTKTSPYCAASACIVPSTHEEKVAKLGADIVARFRVIDNEPQNPAALVDLGITAGGVPVSVHRAVVESDLVIATGIVEPHQYGGYSGGRKTLAVGAAGEALIAHTHGPAFVDHPGTRLGRIEGNPFHEAVTEAARRAGLRFILNVVLDDDKRLLRVTAGDPEEAFQDLVAFARSVYEVPIPQQYDIAIGGVGFPKDSNLYQASRAPSYLFFAPTCVVRPGGYFIIPARCEEGAGSGVGEQRFLVGDARCAGHPVHPG